LFGAVVIAHEAAIDNKALLAMAYALRIGERVHRPCKGEAVYSIEDVCLARAIVADEAIYTRRERDILTLDVLEVND
jgi:hypothetical protein